MPYVLGIDIGNARTAAAVCRLDAPEPPRPVRLGEAGDTVESVLYLERDGSVVVGERADQRAAVEHRRIARGFLGRIGDDVPLVVGGEQYLPQDLAAALVTWVVDQAAARYGPAEHVVVAHRSGWGPYRCGLLHGSLHQFGVRDVTLVPRPIAAAESHVAGSAPVDATLAVCDLGGDTFEAAVVRRHRAGPFQLLGRTEDALGGVHLEDALADHVARSLAVDLDDPDARLAGWWLRRECAAAAQRLCDAAETTIAVRKGRFGRGTEVRVGRAEFEELVEPALRTAADALLRTLRSVAVHPAQLAAVLLVGGSSRLPSVARRIAAELAADVIVDDDPGSTVARGAALVARRVARRDPMEPDSGPIAGVGGVGGGVGSVAADAIGAERAPVLAGVTAGVGGGAGVAAGSGGGAGVAAGSGTGAVGVVGSRIEAVSARGVDLDFGDPPPRPPVEIEPLELPEPRSVMGSLASRPLVAWALWLTLAAGVIALTVLFFWNGR